MLSIFDKWADARNCRKSGGRSGLRLELLEPRVLLSAAPVGEAFEGPELFDLPGQDQETAKVHPGRMIVGYDPEVVESPEEILHHLPGASIAAEFNSSAAVVLQLPGGIKVSEALSSLAERDGVAYAEPDFLYEAQLLPDDPMLNSLWGLHNIGQTGGTPDADIDAPEAWDLTTGSNEVLVGVLDSGIYMEHEDLAENIWVNPGEIPGDGIDNDGNGYVDDVNGWDFYDDTNDPSDEQGHGTHVAGTIGAVGDDGVGVTGVNWDVQIGALAIGIEDTGFVSTSAAVEAVEYATAMGFDVLNMSWGSTGSPSTPLRDAIEAAGEEDVLVVVAAGNSALSNDVVPSYPASFDLDNIISVAASTHNDQMAGFSNYGSTSVDLAAPGQGIFSTRMGGGYVTMDGTSMAAPHVAGVAALLKAYNPDARVNDLRSALLEGAEPLPSLQGLVATGGRLNANMALSQMWTPVQGVDLEVTEAGIIPADVFGVTEVDIDFTVRNFGDTGFEESTSVEFYLSDNNIVDEGDILLDSYDIDGMEPTGIVSDTLHVTGFPPDDPFGTDGFYFMLGVVDPEDVVEEVAEDNNVFAQNVSWARRAIFEDDFSTDTGWTGFAPGRWERGEAVAGGGAFGFPDPAQDASESDDNMLLGYNIGGDYENGISATRWVTSPVIDCSDVRDVNLSFQRWLNVESNIWDEALIEVYDGDQWVELWRNPGIWLTDEEWTQQGFDVSDHADQNGEFQVRFGMGPTDLSVRFSGWNIDDLQVSGKPEREFVPPQITSLNVEELNFRPVNNIQIQFNESIPDTVLSDTANYELTAETWGPISIDSAAGDGDTVMLEINQGRSLPQDQYTLRVLSGGIEDDWGNPLDGNADGDGGDDFVFSFAAKLPGAFAGSLEPNYGGRLTFYDTDYQPGDLEIDVRPEAWITGSHETGITAVGLLPQYTDFGVVIEQAPRSSHPIAIYDQTFEQRPITFIVADANVSELQINSRLAGRDLNGLYVGSGFRLPTDMDGDGDERDESGFFSTGNVSFADLRRGATVDFVSDGEVGALIVGDGAGPVTGEMTISGDLGFLYSGPILESAFTVNGRMGTAILGSGSASEGRVSAGGSGQLTSYGPLQGGVSITGDADSMVIFGNVGQAADGGDGDVSVTGTLHHMLVVNGSITRSAGADLTEMVGGPRIDIGNALGSLELYEGDLSGGLRTGGDAGSIVVGDGNIGVSDGDGPGIEVGGGLDNLSLYGGAVNRAGSGAQIMVSGDLMSAWLEGQLRGGIEVSERADQVLALGGVSETGWISAGGGGGNLFSHGTMAGALESGAGWDSVFVMNGDMTGAISVLDGNLRSLAVVNGSMGTANPAAASVDVAGRLEELILVGGDMYGGVHSGSMGSVDMYGPASMYGTLSSEGAIDRIYVSGDVNGEVEAEDRIGETIIGHSLLGALRGRSLGIVSVGSDVDGATVRAREGGLGRLQVGSDVGNSQVSVAGRLQTVSIGGDFSGSDIHASGLESVRVGDGISGAGHQIRAESGWFRLENRGASWLITEEDDRVIGGVHVHVSA